MKTKAVRIYGRHDLRFDEFELPAIRDDEILAKVVTDSVCMSTWKLVEQGAHHKKAPSDLAENPVIIGHEFCGEILEVGNEWKSQFFPGQRFAIQPNLQLPNAPWCPGYSYQYCGGDATYIVLPADVMNQRCLLPYEGETFFEGSLLEPLSCVVGAFNASYHVSLGTHEHVIGIKSGGNLLILGGTGPMGLLAIDLALHGKNKPKNIVVTGRNEQKLSRAEQAYPGTSNQCVKYIHVSDTDDLVGRLRSVVGGGYDDILLMVADERMITDCSLLLAADGCLNFFAGPVDNQFMGMTNFYDIHYSGSHYVGTSGGTMGDLKESIDLVENGVVNVAKVVTHILGLNDCAWVTENQKQIGGGKKLVYTQKRIALTSLSDISPTSELGLILAKTNGIWSKEAEEYILGCAPGL